MEIKKDGNEMPYVKHSCEECEPKPCPTCHKPPTATVEPSAYNEEALHWLRCEQHGFVACARTLDRAILHWNVFIETFDKRVS